MRLPVLHAPDWCAAAGWRAPADLAQLPTGTPLAVLGLGTADSEHAVERLQALGYRRVMSLQTVGFARLVFSQCAGVAGPTRAAEESSEDLGNPRETLPTHDPPQAEKTDKGTPNAKAEKADKAKADSVNDASDPISGAVLSKPAAKAKAKVAVQPAGGAKAKQKFAK